MTSVLPTGYNPPSVFTRTTIEFSQPIVEGRNKVLAMIGVSEETRTASGVEVIRGSSAQMDNPIYGEDLTNQNTGINSMFQTRHFPIVDGTGKGKTTKDPSTVTVYENGEPVNVVAINGTTGQITLQTAPMLGDVITVDYYFKKKDTLILGEDLSGLVPGTAKVAHIQLNLPTVAPPGVPPAPCFMSMAVTNPGALCNWIVDPNDNTQHKGVSIEFFATGSAAFQAIRNNGTDALRVDIMDETGAYRTADQLVKLINDYAFTKTGGFVVAALDSGLGTLLVDETALINVFGFAGGTGQSSAVLFQLNHRPIVDGTDGGVPTKDPLKVEAYVNGAQVYVQSVDGQHGLITLSQPVPEGATFKVNYYTNNYRDTSDELPHKDVLSVQQCGYSIKGLDFIPDVDFVLDSDTINWGSAVKAYATQTTYGATPFGTNNIMASVVDDYVYLSRALGNSDGQNVIFTVLSTPMEGDVAVPDFTSDDPNTVWVYIGPDPITAFKNNPHGAHPARVSGEIQQIALKVPPPPGQYVYVSYRESRMSDLKSTLTCVSPGPDGIGTYTIMTDKGAVPQFSFNTAGVFDAFINLGPSNTGGLYFPHVYPDIKGVPGRTPTETITLTFVNGDTAEPQLLPGGVPNPAYLKSTSFRITSNRTIAQSKVDGLGITGGTTTPSDPTLLPFTGNLGFLDQTYRDQGTGVSFTILDVSPGAFLEPFGYPDGIEQPYFFREGDQIIITTTTTEHFTCGAGNFVKTIPGINMVVQNTLGVASGDQGVVQTYAKTGNEPDIGDVYYVSYTYAKPEAAYDFQVYYSTQEDQVYKDYGYPSATNKLALGAWLAFRNGAMVIGLMQVKKDPGLLEANDAKYAAALTSLQTLYANMARKPQIIVPLNTSLSFLNYLKKHVETQSSIKMRGECVGFFGFANNTSPSTAISTCQSMGSDRMIVVYPDGGIITISDSFGNSKDIVVDGSFCAVATAALFGDPQWDTATPRTHKNIVGFKRLFRRMDPNVMNTIAQSGCTLIEQVGAAFRLRHAVTTDPSNVLSIQPSITFLKDEIQQDIRDLYDPYIGRKFLNSVMVDMKNDLISYFKSKIDSELVQTYANIQVWRDDTDSRIARVKASYVPVGELTYIFVDLLLRSRAD